MSETVYTESNPKKCSQYQQDSTQESTLFINSEQLSFASNSPKVNLEQTQQSFNAIYSPSQKSSCQSKIFRSFTKTSLECENKRNQIHQKNATDDKFSEQPRLKQNQEQGSHLKTSIATNTSQKIQQKAGMILEISQQLYFRLCNLDEQIEQIDLITKRQLQIDQNKSTVNKYKLEKQEFEMTLLQISEYSHICKGAIIAILPVAENIRRQTNQLNLYSTQLSNTQVSSSYRNPFAVDIAKLNEEKRSLIQEVKMLSAMLENKNHQIEQLSNALSNNNKNKSHMVSNYYEIPIELIIHQNHQQFTLKEQIIRQASRQQCRLTKSFDDSDQVNLSEAEATMKVIQSSKDINLQQKPEPINMTFNKISESQIKQTACVNESQIQQNPNKTALYQIPIEIYLNSEITSPQVQSVATQTNTKSQIETNQKQTFLAFSFQQVSFVHGIKYEQKLFQNKSKVRGSRSNFRLEESDIIEKSSKQHSQEQQSLKVATKQMLMLFQSEELAPKETQISPARVIHEDNDITYNYKKPVHSVQKQEPQRRNSESYNYMDEHFKNSNLFAEFSNVLNNSEERQTDQKDNEVNAEKVESKFSQAPLSKIKAKKALKKSFQISQKSSNQNETSQNELQNSQSYSYPYPYNQQNSQQPSLNIHGISVIKNQHELSQSQSQINDYYLQATQNENSMTQTKVSLQTKFKTRGVSKTKNKSLGTNKFNYPYGNSPYMADNVIEERCNSQQTKSRGTSTHRTININGNAHQNEFGGFEMGRFGGVGRMMFGRGGVAHNYNNLGNLMPRTDPCIKFDCPFDQMQQEKQLYLGMNLFMQKSLILQPNKGEEVEKKKAKQRLSEHPYLNFYETSDMDQISQLKGKSFEQQEMIIDDSKINEILVAQCINEQRKMQISQKSNLYEAEGSEKEAGDGREKGMTINSGSFFQQSILINMNNVSNFERMMKESKGLEKFKQTILAQAKEGQGEHEKNENKNTSGKSVVKNLKNANNQVYIIDGETSSQGSRANREMRISQMKFNLEHSKNQSSNTSQMFAPLYVKMIPPLTSRNNSKNSIQIKENAIDQNDYFEQNKRINQLEQQKASLSYRLNESEQRMELMKKIEVFQSQKLQQREQIYSNKMQLIINKLEQSDQKLSRLSLDIDDKCKTIKILQKQCEQKQKTIQQLEKVKQRNQLIVQSLANQLKSSKLTYESNIHSLCQINKMQTNQIHSQKQQISHFNQPSHFKSFQQSIKTRTKTMETNLFQIESKSDKIEQLKRQKWEIMNNIQIDDSLSPQSQQLLKIYEGRFEKTINQCQKIILNQNGKIIQLQNQNIDLAKIVGQLAQRVDDLKKKKWKTIETVEKEQRNKRGVYEESENGTNESQVLMQLNLLRKQLVCKVKQVQQKQGIIEQLSNQIKEFNHVQYQSQSSRNHQTKSQFYLNLNAIKHNQQTKHNSHTSTSTTYPNIPILIPTPRNQPKRAQLIESIQDFEQYIEELEQMILEYEEMLVANQKIINDLHTQVSNYMQEAIDNENENQSLYKDLANYQEQVNSILKQKISLEIQNKRMKKMIAASQRKMSAIGTRLIHAAKDKIKIRQEIQPFDSSSIGGTPMSQNSTLKLRELKIE